MKEGQNFRKAGEFGPMAGHVNPDFAAYARACGADGYRVDTLTEFEDAFQRALDSGRPSVIDAKITRWAVPSYSPSPDGMIAGLAEAVETRLRSG